MYTKKLRNVFLDGESSSLPSPSFPVIDNLKYYFILKQKQIYDIVLNFHRFFKVKSKNAKKSYVCTDVATPLTDGIHRPALTYTFFQGLAGRERTDIKEVFIQVRTGSLE